MSNNIEQLLSRPTIGVEGAIGNIQDQASALDRVVNSILNPTEGEGTITHVNDDGFEQIFTLHTITNDDGVQETVAVETIESQIAHASYALSQGHTDVDDQIDNYRAAISNQVSEILSVSEQRGIDNAELAIDATASIDDFENSIDSLLALTGDLESQLNNLAGILNLGLLNSISSSAIGNINSNSSQNLDSLQTITLADGRTVKKTNDRTLLEAVFGANGLAQDPEAIDDPNYLINAGADDLLAILSNVAGDNLVGDVSNLLAIQNTHANQTMWEQSLQKRGVDRQGNAVINNNLPVTGMSSFTPASAALLGFAQQLSDMVNSGVGSLIGENGLLDFDLRSVNVAAEGEDPVMVNMRFAADERMAEIFMPSPSEDLDPNNPADAEKLALIDQYLLENGHTNQINIPVADFNQFIQDNQAQIMSQIQSTILQSFVDNPQILQARAELAVAQQEFDNYKNRLEGTRDSLDNKSQALDAKSLERATIETNLQQAITAANPDTALIDQLRANLDTVNDDIDTLNNEIDALNQELDNLRNQQEQIQSNLRDKAVAFSDILTGNVDGPNGLEGEVQNAINDNLDSRIDQLRTEVTQAGEDLAVDILHSEDGLFDGLEDLITGELNPDITSADQIDMRELIKLMFILSIFAQNEWDTMLGDHEQATDLNSSV